MGTPAGWRCPPRPASCVSGAIPRVQDLACRLPLAVECSSARARKGGAKQKAHSNRDKFPEPMPAATFLTGAVESFSIDRGIGVILADNGKRVHFTGIAVSPPAPALQAGDRVQVRPVARGDQLNATSVVRESSGKPPRGRARTLDAGELGMATPRKRAVQRRPAGWTQTWPSPVDLVAEHSDLSRALDPG